MTQRTKYSVIWLFGSPKDPNIWLFVFGYLGHPKKTEETKFGNKSGSQIMHCPPWCLSKVAIACTLLFQFSVCILLPPWTISALVVSLLLGLHL
jgi:hypothetical protein